MATNLTFLILEPASQLFSSMEAVAAANNGRHCQRPYLKNIDALRSTYSAMAKASHGRSSESGQSTTIKGLSTPSWNTLENPFIS